MFRVSTTPIIRSTQNCNYSLRYSAGTSLQRGEAWPHWREVAAQKIWPVPEAVVTVFCTPNDGRGWHPKHVEWTCRIINRLLCIASRWTNINARGDCLSENVMLADRVSGTWRRRKGGRNSSCLGVSNIKCNKHSFFEIRFMRTYKRMCRYDEVVRTFSQIYLQMRLKMSLWIQILVDLGQYGNIYWVCVMGAAWHAKRSAISDQSCDSYRPHGISKWG